ncbi:hypothetical protein [Pseudomonas meliae]|nr:hypothetical protein [Pseudomonas meliae]
MLLLPDEHQWTDISKIQVQAKKGICNDLQSKWPRPAIIAFLDRD